jgi:hypothetical protein
MPVSTYTVSIPIFIQHVNGLNAVLDNAAAWGRRAQGQPVASNCTGASDKVPITAHVAEAWDRSTAPGATSRSTISSASVRLQRLRLAEAARG